MKWTDDQLAKVAKRAQELAELDGECECQEAKELEMCKCTAQAFLTAFQEITWDSKTPEERTARVAHAVASYFRPSGTPKHYADGAEVHARNLFPIVQRELMFAPELVACLAHHLAKEYHWPHEREMNAEALIRMGLAQFIDGPKPKDESVREINELLRESPVVSWTKTQAALELGIQVSSQSDLSDVLKITLKVDGTWEYERESDDGRDPFNRDMTEPYEP